MKKDNLQIQLEQIAAKLQGTLSLYIEVGDESFVVGPQHKFSAASLIKVPVLMAAFQRAQKGELDLQRPVIVPEKEKVGGSGVLSRLSPGLALPLIDLLTLMIIVSDNTATNICIDEVGLGEINALMESAGCTETVLGRRLMDYEARKAGRDNFATARDMVKLFRELWEGKLLTPENREKALAILSEQQFRDKLPRLIPAIEAGDAIFAHKTGELSGVEHDAGILVRDGKPAFIAALTSDLQCSSKGREALGEIGRAVWEYMNHKS